MQRLHENYRVVIHIKNHNLCISIILILFFLLGINLSHIYNEESNVYLKIADSLNRAYTGGGIDSPLLPRVGGESIMFDS